MRQPTPAISVVVPTWRRLASLRRMLASLEKQDLPLDQFEVVVIADGDDEAGEFLKAYRGPLQLRHAVQPPSGAGAARNRGAQLAIGARLLFLDDDTEPRQDAVRQHLVAADAQRVCLGSLTTVLPRNPGFLAVGARNWWEHKLRAMREIGHRFDYTDLLSGHFSLSAEVFRAVGGFNPDFPCREDYELGARLIKQGVRFHFLHAAEAYHHETPELARILRRGQGEGVGDVRLARCHPELIPTLGLARVCNARRREDRLMMAAPRCMELWCSLMTRTLGIYETLGLRKSWERCFVRAKTACYMRGVVAECASWSGLEQLVATSAPVAVDPMEVDLAEGLAQAEAKIDAGTPAAVRLLVSGYPIGVIPAGPLMEPVRGKHLRPFLREVKSYEFLVGLAWQTLARTPSNLEARCP